MTFHGELKPFQKTAVARMIERKKLGLFLSLGLGKTICAIAAVEELIDSELIGGGIIVCSKTVKAQWKRQIEKFTQQEANIIVVDGTGPRRMQQYVEYASGGVEYLIINIEQVVNDWEIIRKLPRDFVICDEVQVIRGFKSKRSKLLKKLRAEYQWGLSGQPIENLATDIFSIFEWIDPTVLGDWETFDKTFLRRNHWGKVTKLVNGPILYRALSEAMIRVSREEVSDQMPNVVEESLLIDFDVEGARLYRVIMKELLNDLAEATPTEFNAFKFYSGEDRNSSQIQGRIASKVICLRMLCDHPDLLRISANHFADGESKRSGSAYAAELVERGLLNRITKTPKLDALLEEIEQILTADPANKVVLFSYFKDMLNIIQVATSNLTNSVLFTGDMNVRARGTAIDTFTKNANCRLFLSSDAGGEGLDLPMANYLISVDLPWSAGGWKQRNGRIDRISSLFPGITLISTLMSESVEEWLYDSVLAPKQRLGDAIIDGKGWSNKGVLTLNIQSLTKFLLEHQV